MAQIHETDAMNCRACGRAGARVRGVSLHHLRHVHLPHLHVPGRDAVREVPGRATADAADSTGGERLTLGPEPDEVARPCP